MTATRKMMVKRFVLLYTVSFLVGVGWYFLDRFGPYLVFELGKYYQISPLEILDENAPMNIIMTYLIMLIVTLFNRWRGKPPAENLRFTATIIHAVCIAAVVANCIFYLPHHAVWFIRPRGTFTMIAFIFSGITILYTYRPRAATRLAPTNRAKREKIHWNHWRCPLCGSDNQIDALRCLCGYELEEKNLLSLGK